MTNSPTTISPRLRARESAIVPAPAAASRAGEPPSSLRVLVRLPNVAAPKPAVRRFKFTATLFSTLRRKYAAAAFGVFLVCMVIMLIRGKRGQPEHGDSANDAPRWNSTLTVPTHKEPVAAPVAVQPPASTASAEGPTPWELGPRPAADTSHQAAADGRWQHSLGTAGGPTYSSAPSPDDRIPAPPVNPYKDSAAARQYPTTTAPNDYGPNLRLADRSSPNNQGPATPSFADRPGAPHLDGMIGPPNSSFGDPTGQRNFR